MSDSHNETARKPEGQGRARFASWFTAWRKPIRHWMSTLSMVPAADLDDVAQEVFLRLSRYSEDVAVKNPKGYLFRVAASVAKEWRERARFRRPHDQSLLEEPQIEAADNPENTTAGMLLHDHVQAVVRTLPQRQRIVLMLHVNEGLTYKQIADRKGLTYRAVLKDLTRAYCQLRMALSAEDLGEIGDQGAARAVRDQDSSPRRTVPGH